MSLAARKTAFLNVLSANLDQNIQSEIKAFWEEKYSDKPQFGVSAFLDELYSNYDISIKKGSCFGNCRGPQPAPVSKPTNPIKPIRTWIPSRAPILAR